jgi:hypothetical protein
MLNSITALDLLIAFAVVTVAAVLQGAVGLGMGLVAAPLLNLVATPLVPGPLLFSIMILGLFMAYRERRAIRLQEIAWGIVGRIGGTVVAGWLILRSNPDMLSLWIGVAVVIAVMLSISGLSVRLTWGTLVGAGVVSGVLATIASVGGTPMALLYQHESGAHLRSTLSGFFVLGAVISLMTLAITGHFGPTELLCAVTLAPGALLGFGISGRILPLLNPTWTRWALLLLAGLSGLFVILRQVF